MRSPKSKIIDAVYKTANGLHAAGAISKAAMCRFERLAPQPAGPRKAKTQAGRAK